MTASVSSDLATRIAQDIENTFAAYHDEFKEITRRAKQRFEQRDWHGLHNDAVQRLDLYRSYVADSLSRVQPLLTAHTDDIAFWAEVKEHYSQAIAGRHDFEIAESFFNSVTMRVDGSKRVDPRIQYVGTEPHEPVEPREQTFRPYKREGATSDLVRQILVDCCFACDYGDLEKDASRVAEQIEKALQETERTADTIESIEIAEPVFYRGKGAYLVGRVCTPTGHLPMVIALANTDGGIYVDAVLLTRDEVSIVFSFARSYFHAEIDRPRALVSFLKAIMPRKPVAELYISLGYNKHGKTELYRDLIRHLHTSDDKFEIARGERGMVMVVFTLPTYDVVFKIIKDRFDYPKTTTRQEVRDRYYLVFQHDRGGRLVDAQEFEHLRFAKDRFSPALLEELLREAANTVSVEGDEVVIAHLYTERRLIPLNLYVREVDRERAVHAVIDYGQTIKDLAYTNIFPGDILLKNFGVTRHGRIVFYDYDELCLLTDCTFRKMPEPRDDDEDEYMASEPWFSVSENDVFPEELKTFLGLPPDLAEVFVQHHGELFGVDFWADLVARHRAGEVIDVLPYRESRRLHDPT
jgi:isocitrate dehydrogenase kinase/phosphatase